MWFLPGPQSTTRKKDPASKNLPGTLHSWVRPVSAGYKMKLKVIKLNDEQMIQFSLSLCLAFPPSFSFSSSWQMLGHLQSLLLTTQQQAELTKLSLQWTESSTDSSSLWPHTDKMGFGSGFKVQSLKVGKTWKKEQLKASAAEASGCLLTSPLTRKQRRVWKQGWAVELNRLLRDPFPLSRSHLQWFHGLSKRNQQQGASDQIHKTMKNASYPNSNKREDKSYVLI